MTSTSTTDIENLCTLFDKQTDLTTKLANDQIETTDSQSNIQIRRPLTVSTLAHYFGLQCDEYLRLSLNRQIDSNHCDTLKNSLTKQRGITFEGDIKSYHSSSILSNIYDEHEFLSYLRSSISSPTEPRIGYNIKFRWTYDDHLQSNYKPDFLLIKHLINNNNRIEITIADAKSSSRMRIEHCIQVALYAIDLRVWIERNKLDEQVFINDIGEIWLPSENESILYERKIFPMEKLRSRLEHFLKDNLDKALTGSEWIMLPRCSFCSFAPRCRQRAMYHEPESINNLSYLTSSSHSLIDSFFHSTLFSSIDLQLILNHSNENLFSDDKIRLQKILSVNTEKKTSAVIQALQTHEPQLKEQTSLLIPKQNKDLILLFLLLISNPSQLHSLALFAYNIYDTSKQSWISSQPILQSYPSPLQVVSMIAQSLNKLREDSQRPCQIVLFDEQEKTILFEQLTLASDSEHIGECLILLSSSENAILLNHPPDVIQTDRLFRSHPLSNVTKEEIEQELYHRYGSVDDKNKKSTKTDLAQQLRELNVNEQDKARENLIGLPCLISLHTAIRQSFVVPMPGFFDLEDLKYSFQISLPSSSPNELLESIHKTELTNLVQEHLSVLARLYSIIQKRLFESNRLQLDASPIPNITRINSSHPHIRRLIFLRQYEMLYTLRSIQQTRFDVNEPPVILRIIDKKSVDKYNHLWECQIERGQEIISKNVTENVTNTNDFRTYPYLISQDNYSIRTFPDAVYMDSAIDGIRSRTKLDQCGLAHVELKGEGGESIFIRVKLCSLALEINEQYYLSERYVDFNTKKAIQGLEQATPLTIQILDDPRVLTKPQAVQKTSQTMQQQISNMFSKREPSIKPEGLHMLNKAQQKACEKVKNERVTLIWGPPGTGKTYWSGVTVFQMLMFSSTPLRVLITACTHTAIDNLLSSINHLKLLFSSSPQFPQWYKLSQELNVLKLDSKNFGSLSSSFHKSSVVAGSTVWTLQKLNPSLVFDIIFVDESTQLLTSDAVLAINRLADHSESRLIVAGDPLQLPPIKRCIYPPLPHPVPDLFSSLFHCLLRDENNIPISLHTEKPFEEISRCPYLSVFDENHRMNDQLSDFTRLLYGENYRQGRSTPLLSIRSVEDSNEYLLGSRLDPYSSLYTLLIDSSSCSYSSRSEDLELESRLVSSLIDELIYRVSPSSIFIITPHRMQRSAIREKLSGKKSCSNILINCDTVERMQGKEAECVILCMLYRQSEILENELDFIYNRQRINVSITRAKQLCILLTSQLLFNQPPLQLFVNGNTRNAYTLLTNYVNKSIQISLDNHGNIK